MKLLFYTCLIALYTLPGYGQEVWFRDDFEDNSQGWLIQKNNMYANFDVKDGHYIIDNHDTRGYWYYASKNVYINYEKDYKLTSRFKVNATDGQNGSGIFIKINGSKYFTYNVDNYVFFLIEPSNGKFWIGQKSYKDEWLTYSGKPDNAWVKSKNINPVGEYNELAIKREGNKVSFIINGKVVHSVNADDNMRLARKGFGAALFTQSNVSYDYFQFEQDNWSDVLSPTAHQLEAVNNEVINSDALESTPVLTADGQTLFFCRMRDANNVEGFIDSNTSGGDIYVSHRVNDKWTEPQNIGKPVSDMGHNAVFSASPDGNSILVMAEYGNDIRLPHISSKSASGWTKPELLEIDNFYSQSKLNNFFLAADWQTLVMTIQRKESLGNADLYVSFRKKDGSFTEPLYMGENINSVNLEFAPFLASDGKTLYYASWGLPGGYGESDIYMTKRLDDTWQNWSDPVNIGPAVNNIDHNGYYSISADGQKILFTSETNARGWQDIFVSETPEELKPEPVLIVKGHVYNSKTAQPLSAVINYYDLNENNNLGQTISDPATGYYSIVLPLDKDVGFLAQTANFLSVSDNVMSNDLHGKTIIERDLLLTPIEEGAVVRLNNIFFDTNKTALKEESFNELDRLVNVMQQNPAMIIEIRGHTDNIGQDDYNLSLSIGRAESVLNYLAKEGIPKDRLTSKGFGETSPIANNETKEGRDLNRRVEFYIASN